MSNALLSPHSTTVRFDLLTVFSAVTVWALLLATMGLLGFPVHGYAIVSLLLVAVASARFVFRRLNHPRLVSMGAGLAFTLLGEAALRAWQGLPGGIPISLVPMGVAYGALADLFFGAVWLIARWMRLGLTSRCS